MERGEEGRCLDIFIGGCLGEKVEGDELVV